VQRFDHVAGQSTRLFLAQIAIVVTVQDIVELVAPVQLGNHYATATQTNATTNRPDCQRVLEQTQIAEPSVALVAIAISTLPQ